MWQTQTKQAAWTTSPPLRSKRPGGRRLQGSMGQLGSKVKQVVGRQPTTKTTVQSIEAKKLVDFMEGHYDSKIKDVQSFDEFYHAIYELIEMYCEGHGQFQYKIPDKKTLEEQYMKVNPRPKDTKNLEKKEFMEIAENLVSMNSFTAGPAFLHVIGVLFGAPVCALLVKKVLPGLRSLDDDVVIPVATSGAVFYLAKTNKL